MKKRLRKWLGIVKLYALVSEALRRVQSLENENVQLKARLDDLESRLMDLDGRLPARTEQQKPGPRKIKTWTEAKELLEKAKEISYAREN